jgi:hypothetical protein
MKNLHAAADSIEPRMARAFERAAQRLRARVSINDLALAIQSGDVRAAMLLLPASVIVDALTPVGGIVRDAVLRGGRIGSSGLEV